MPGEGVVVVVGGVVDLHDRTDNSSLLDHKSAREEGEGRAEGTHEARYHDATANLLPRGGNGGMGVDGGRVSRLGLECGVPSSIVGDPKGWGHLLRQVPEVGESSAGSGVDFSATYDEFATSLFRLVGINNRAMREYESAERRSREHSARLEEQIAELRRLNVDLANEKVALGGSCEEERSLREGAEQALCAKANELESVKAELERAENQARLREEEVRGLSLKLEKEREIAGRVEGLEKEVARLESDAAIHEGEISAMDHGCRATLKRLLKEQADALYAGYEAKNDCMGLKLDHFLESRAEYDKVAKELFRAEGARDVFKSLREKDGVPIPDSKFTRLDAEVSLHKRRAESLAVEDFHSGKLLLGLPEEIGAIEVERLDFKSARYALVRDDAETGERGGTSAETAEGETEESPNAGSEDGEEGRTAEEDEGNAMLGGEGN